MTNGRTRRVLLWLLAAAVYYGAVELSDAWTRPGMHAPLLWLPTGFGFAIATVGGRAFAAAPALAMLAHALVEGRSWWQVLALAAGAGLSALAMLEVARLLHSGNGERAANTIGRTTACAVGAAIGAAATVVVLSRPQLFGHVFLAQLAGAMVVAPFSRSWLQRHRWGNASRLETVAMLVATAGAAELTSSGALGVSTPLSYVMFLPLLWAALRTGRRGVSTAVLLLAAIAASNLSAGNGPFVGMRAGAAVAFDTYVIVVATTALLLVGVEHARSIGEERFRALIENGSDLVTVIAPDGTVAYESPSVKRILGYAPEEIVGTSSFQRVHSDDRAFLAGVIDAAANGEDATCSFRVRHRDGWIVELEAHVRDLSQSPSVGGVLVNARDVTASRRAERDLAAAERRFRELVEDLPLVFFIKGLGPGADLRYVSPQAEALLGCPLERWLEDAESLVHPEDRVRLDGSFDSAEYRLLAADGREVWVVDQRVTLTNEDGAPAAVQGFLIDVTERKRLEEQLRQSQRLESIGLLAGGVAHDFNNLLTAITGYGELARASLVRDTHVRDDLDEVLRAAGRASDLTRQLLAFGRRQTMVSETVDLNEVVERTQALVTRLLDVDIEVVCLLDSELGAVHADPGQLEQVLLNLALNARDAMDAGGTLTFATCNETVEPGEPIPPGDYVVVSVADTGHGIDPEVRERLFEPFFTTKELGKGTGLGLAVVFGIVDQSRGHVVVRSEPGRGSEFRVMLPRTDELCEPVARRIAAPVSGTETLLLVEDEEIVRRLTGTMLERQGYRVLTASCGDEALAVREPYDLLLTDVVMPGMSGPQLVERLAAEGRHPAVLFTSGYSAATVADGAELPGILLEKPFTLEQLAAKVREALDVDEHVLASR